MTENLLGVMLSVLLWTCTGESEQQLEQGQEQVLEQQEQEQQQLEEQHEQVQQIASEETAGKNIALVEDPGSSMQVSINLPEKDMKVTVISEQVVNIHDHQIWDGILNEHVSKTGTVNYVDIKKDRSTLDMYLKQLAKNPVQESWSRSQQLAYWTNAYNAFTVDLIVRNYPLKSIMDLDKPWDQKFIHLGNKTYSLNEIEHEIVRPTFKDARVHFAFVCAAVSCPKLLNTAYLPQKLDQQLDAQTRFFLNTSGKNQLSPNLVKISKLFDWYGEDFTSQGTLIEFLNMYSNQEISVGAKMAFLEYDWKLNE